MHYYRKRAWNCTSHIISAHGTLARTMVGRIMPAPPKDVHVLVSGTWMLRYVVSGN